MNQPHKLQTFQPKAGPLVSYIGPDLSHGPLPALLYFTLSAKASLLDDPFNQLTLFCHSSKLRIFSCDLPYHNEDPKSFDTAISFWAYELSKGNNIIMNFIEELALGLDSLIHDGFIDPAKIAAAGLSRGALIATHLATKDPRISSILGFAPLTKLHSVKEFVALPDELCSPLDLVTMAPQLVSKKLRFYIGNRDTRVSTSSCFDFIHTLAEHNFQKKIRSSPVELFISSSCGRDGHGTLPHIFKDGSNWIKEQLCIERDTL